MLVAEIMTRAVHSCRPDDTLDRAAQRMWDHDIGCVPVLDAMGGVIGMLTDRDICMAAFMKGRPLPWIPVREAMATNVVACAPDATVESAAAAMGAHQIHRMPVVEQGTLVGIISVNDLVRHANDISPSGADVLAALAAICRPRQGPPPRHTAA